MVATVFTFITTLLSSVRFFSQNYIFEGLLLPFTLSLAILRLTLEWDSSLAELSHFSLEICALQRHLESTFLDTWLYMNSGSVLFRSEIKIRKLRLRMKQLQIFQISPRQISR